MRFGAHMSIAGSIDRAVDRAVEVGCDTLQVFTKSARQWAARPLRDEEVEAFQNKRSEAAIDPVVAHASYLINLGAVDQDLWTKSCQSFSEEVDRCARLGIDGIVIHPGAHGGEGEEAGLRRIAAALETVMENSPTGPRILLETTAGQGTSIGGQLEHLRWLLDRLGVDRLGVCLDTCHLHAAGYSLDSQESVDRSLAEVELVIGLDQVFAMHCNDSVGEAGSHRDRHAHIGAGTIGESGFTALMTDRRLRGVAAILETPKDDEGAWDRANLARLRAMHRGERPLPPMAGESSRESGGEKQESGEPEDESEQGARS
jgi:deoxyribonuclease-4